MEQTDTLLFLGSGAADWNLEDRDGFFRRHAAALLNGTTLLDCGAHIWDFTETWQGALDGVTDVLVTHDHDDHFHLPSLLCLAEKRKLRVACDGYLRAKIGAHPNIAFVHMQPFVPFHMGRYKVTPLLANHDVVLAGERMACHYILETPNKKTVFYGLDGAWFLRPSWEEMRRHTFDLMVLDCTVGDREDWRIFEHNTIPMLRIMVKQIEEAHLLRKNGQIVASHFSRLLCGTHEETARTLEQFRVRAAFDSMRIHF